jgi:hypothetical protein
VFVTRFDTLPPSSGKVSLRRDVTTCWHSASTFKVDHDLHQRASASRFYSAVRVTMDDEWINHGADEPVQQGDLLLSRDSKTGYIEELCTVITADCDIAHQKFGKQLACLPVASLRDYLRTDWAERKLHRSFDTETEKIRAQLDKWNAQRDANAGPLSSEVIINWVKRCEPDQICQELKIPEPAAAKVRTTLARFRSAVLTLVPDGSADNLARLVRFRAAASGQPRDECRKEILRQAQSDSLPDDVFLLPALPQLPDVGPAVVFLRELIGIPFGNICFRSYDAISKNHFLRIGRLNPIIKYAVSQAFGIVYTRIGLPETYENRRRAAIEQISSFEWE